MNQRNAVLDCYSKTAGAYADAFSDELAHKPLDRLLLTRFADEHRQRGPVIDLGCGPGQTTAFLHGAGLTDLVGTDISPDMIAVARQRHVPTLRFEVADMGQLPYEDAAFGGAVAFYAIVHFTMYEVAVALEEVCRVLKPQGQLLFSFHAQHADDTPSVYHRAEFLGQPVDVNVYFFDVDAVLSLAAEAGFRCVDALIRHPYPAEYPSKRAYILLSKQN